MLPFFIERGHVIKVHHNAVDTDTNKTRSAHLFKNMQVLTFSVAHDRRQEHQFAAFRQRQDGVNHLGDGLGLEGDAVGGASRIADPRKQQTQVVVYLGNGANGGARVVRRGFLLDGDRR